MGRYRKAIRGTMKYVAPAVALLLTVGLCVWGSDWVVRRLLLWIIVLMVALWR